AGRREEAEKNVKDLPSLFQHNKEVREFEEKQSWTTGTGILRNLFGINMADRGVTAADRIRLSGEADALNSAPNQLKQATARADAAKEAADKAKIAADEEKNKSVAAAAKAKEGDDQLHESKKQQAEWLDQQTKIQKAQQDELDYQFQRQMATGGASTV